MEYYKIYFAVLFGMAAEKDVRLMELFRSRDLADDLIPMLEQWAEEFVKSLEGDSESFFDKKLSEFIALNLPDNEENLLRAMWRDLGNGKGEVVKVSVRKKNPDGTYQVYANGEQTVPAGALRALEITVYADTTGWFSEEVCERDNLTEITVPYELWKQYVEHCFPGENPEKFLDEYTADSTDGLVYFCKDKGWTETAMRTAPVRYNFNEQGSAFPVDRLPEAVEQYTPNYDEAIRNALVQIRDWITDNLVPKMGSARKLYYAFGQAAVMNSQTGVSWSLREDRHAIAVFTDERIAYDEGTSHYILSGPAKPGDVDIFKTPSILRPGEDLVLHWSSVKAGLKDSLRQQQEKEKAVFGFKV